MSRQAHSENGIIHVPSKYSVPETIRRLDGVVKSKRLTVFAHIEFSGDAAKVGLCMRPTQLLILAIPIRYAVDGRLGQHRTRSAARDSGVMPTNVELAIKLAGSYHQSQVVESCTVREKLMYCSAKCALEHPGNAKCDGGILAAKDTDLFSILAVGRMVSRANQVLAMTSA